MKLMPSLPLIQSWVRRFHPEYVILQAPNGGYAALHPDEIAFWLGRGFMVVTAEVAA